MLTSGASGNLAVTKERTQGNASPTYPVILAYTEQTHRLGRHITRTNVHSRHSKTPLSRTGDPVGFLKRQSRAVCAPTGNESGE